MKKISKHLIAFAIISLFAVPMFIAPALAQTDIYGVNQLNNGLGGSLGPTNRDPREIIGRFLKLALGFLGLIAVAIILIGGFKWMTSGGNEEKTGEAKKLMAAGVVGLIIVLASWGIATWVISSIGNTVKNA
jgi:hypothetical protein